MLAAGGGRLEVIIQGVCCLRDVRGTQALNVALR